MVKRVFLLWVLSSCLVTHIVVKIKFALQLRTVTHQKQTSVELGIDQCRLLIVP
jgi:hypothetical protein